ncbi:ComEC/Rec2 family competence protein [Albibacterium profundi]|uniref:ComEC/Rec2 family competence protein n=1 Tax=Albibacterium profundi TaxID=3134906 RepID=A0ABV5CA10_9SPHI
MDNLKSDDIRLMAMPFVRFIIVLIAGISMGHWIQPRSGVYCAITIVMISSLVLFFICIWVTKLASYKDYLLFSILFYAFLFSLGWSRTWQQDPRIQRDHFSNRPSDALIGYIGDEPKVTAKTIRFPLQVSHQIKNGIVSNSSGRLLISIQRDTINDNTKKYAYGDQLLAVAEYDTIRSNFNPNEFNYQKYMIGQAVWHQSYLTEDLIKKVGEKQGKLLVRWSLDFREKMVAKFNSIFPDKDVQVIISTLVLGYRSELNRDLLNTFSVTGTIHVLSVSGLHVGIIFSVFSFLLLWKKKSKWMWIKAICLISLIWIYAFITGLSPSVLRASIMLSSGILALSIVRKSNIYNTIAFSAFVLLLYNPRFISDIGFQLSYLSVLGIVYFYPKFNSILRNKNSIIQTLWSYMSISLAAQLATFPLVTYYFHFFPLYFLPANLFILLPATIILYVGILVLLLPSSFAQYGLAWILENSIHLTKKVLTYFEELPYASLNLIWSKPWHFIILYTIILAVVFFVSYSRKKALYVVCIGMLLLVGDWSLLKMKELRTDEIIIYNAGQNTAIGIFSKEGAFLYTDFSDQEDASFQYSVKPNFSAFGKEAEFIGIADTLARDELLIINRFIQIRNKSLFLYDGNVDVQGTIDVDILYLKNNSLASLSEIYSKIHFEKVVLDATNAWWYIREITEETEKMNLPMYVLKNNNAYVW